MAGPDGDRSKPVLRLVFMLSRFFDGGVRETRVVTVLAIVLVLARTAVFTLSESIYFDSDQAVVGLMAKHLAEFRTFPLFYYGLNYMLGVQAWLAAPLFWIARPSVTVLRLPLVALNVAAALLLVRLISRELKLRPAVSLVAALPFIMPTPLMAAAFVETNGAAGVEPLLYVLFLWLLRRRPLAFGAVLAFGALHREFTLYALPALAIVSVANWPGQAGLPGLAKWSARALASFGLVWLIIDDIKLHLLGSSVFMEARMMAKLTCFTGTGIVQTLRNVGERYLPVLMGTTTVQVEPPLRNAAVVGHPAMGWLLAVAFIVMAVRLVWLWWRTGNGVDVRFGAYLALIGAITLGVYSMTCGAQSGAPITLRYLHLTLLLPIGCFAVFAAKERMPYLRWAMVAVFCLWGASNLIDNGQVAYAARVHPEVDPHRVLADYLVGHQIRYARANYWDAYIVDFFAREKVIVASTPPVRVPEYERLVDEHPQFTVTIQRLPCTGQIYVSQWCIQVPPH